MTERPLSRKEFMAALGRFGAGGCLCAAAAGMHAAFAGQNVYLYCASEGLATVVRASVDKAVLGQTLLQGPGCCRHQGHCPSL